MSSVPRYTPRYSVSDYQLWEGDWELWDGIAIAMPQVRSDLIRG